MCLLVASYCSFQKIMGNDLLKVKARGMKNKYIWNPILVVNMGKSDESGVRETDHTWSKTLTPFFKENYSRICCILLIDWP